MGFGFRVYLGIVFLAIQALLTFSFCCSSLPWAEGPKGLGLGFALRFEFVGRLGPWVRHL